MATTGKIQDYNPELERFSTYVERLRLYFEANNIPENRRVPVFLTVIGTKNYSLLSDFYSPDKPKDKDLEELITTLQSHFDPPLIVIAERFHFYKRDQRSGESIVDFVAELRRLATNCKFGTSLDDALRDRFVCGLKSEDIQKRLLTEKELTMKGAVELATSLYSAEKNSCAMQPMRAGDVKAVRISQQPCFRCGRKGHGASVCRFKDATCHVCGKKGHIASVCRNKKESTAIAKKKGFTVKHKVAKNDANWVGIEDEDSDCALFTVTSMHSTQSSPPISARVKVNGVYIEMELDTGAAMSLISQSTKDKLLPSAILQTSDIVLRTYSSQPIIVVGQTVVQVRYEDQEAQLPLLVVEGKGPSLIGRNWMSHINFNWKAIKCTRASTSTTELDSLLMKYPSVFEDKLGTMKHFRAKLEIKEGATPKFFRPRPVPFALKENIEHELDRLERDGIITKVNHSSWAAPIVPVPKRDGKLRICGDYKVTLNAVLEVDSHPLPKPDDLFATLSGGKIFSKIDLSQAYQQMLLHEDSKPLVTINTHKGLYQYNRLPFGIASAPVVFQRTMDTVLQGIPNVICYIDDILVSGPDLTTHLQSLEEVLQRLSAEGITVKRSKCKFLTNQVEYLGYVVDEQGLHSSDQKLEAIVKFPVPKNVQQLRSLLGMINYYGKFVPNLASIVHPLNKLLRLNCKWKWTKQCDQALSQVKEKLLATRLLVHYNSDLQLRLATDASAYGVGAVISHLFPNGDEKPIAFASRTLSTAEKNYPQIEKEALSIVFGIKKFHQYLYGRKFDLITDHKPLAAILRPTKAIPSLAAARMQRWALLLSAYSYDISYRPTKEHANADCLSRLPLDIKEGKGSTYFDSVFNIGQVESLPLTSKELSTATKVDPTLSKVARFIQTGWPSIIPANLKPYFNRKLELTLEKNCLLWGIRVVIPEKYRDKVLHQLHTDHPGIGRMKSIARSHVWWPGLDADIEHLAKSCESCLSVKSNTPPKSPLNPWLWPTTPWTRIHIDFAGPIYGKNYLVIVDAHSKWPEVFEMTSTTTSKTIDVLRHLFSSYGLPNQLVSDNGPQFTSDEFQVFLKSNGIKHSRTAPYHPATNGAAERFVQTLKKSIKVGRGDRRSSQHKLASFLLTYRSTPHSVTGVAPCQLFLNRQIKTIWNLVKPTTVDQTVANNQANQKNTHDLHARQRNFNIGDPILVQCYRQNQQTWQPGLIVERLGPVSFLVEVDSKQRKVHIDQILAREENEKQSSTVAASSQLDSEDSVESTAVTEDDEENLNSSPVMDGSNDAVQDLVVIDNPVVADDPVVETHSSQFSSRYPVRERHPPDRFF